MITINSDFFHTSTRVFKEVGAQAIYDYLENRRQLKWREIAEKPGVFSTGLERMLGSAAPVVENLILMNLYCKLGLKFVEKKGYDLSDCVLELWDRCGC